MKDGFLKVACATPAIRVADTDYNAGQITDLIGRAAEAGAKLVLFPELCVTGYTCGDLFLQRTLKDGALDALHRIAEATGGSGLVAVVGCPLEVQDKLYNCAAVLSGGRVLGVVPKTFVPNYGEFYELRHFSPAPAETGVIRLWGQEVPFGTRLLFRQEEMPEFTLAAEICEDVWVPCPPSTDHCRAGATVIVNPSASDEIIGKSDYRRSLMRSQSARLLCGYLYADCGEGESTTDLVFAGHNLIAENGSILAESGLFTTGLTVTELDLQRLKQERARQNTFSPSCGGYTVVPFSLPVEETRLTRPVAKSPFVPAEGKDLGERCETILSLQAAGLKKRLAHTGCKTAVLGISGGLDSTLALLVAVRAMNALGRSRKDIVAVTMPCFGTTARTKSNAMTLAEQLGVTLQSVDIADAVRIHFGDIGQREDVHDVTFENAQARERTQVLMDLANRLGGLVIGTGDLSELALGFATYNGDHMSMYGVNASVPKTLVRHLTRYEAERLGGQARDTLLDILDTPVSPELLPLVDGEVVQKTEDIVGPYELHDFFLYYMLRFGFSPKKIYRLAKYAFQGEYEDGVILHWLKMFYRRFFSQQFKRSCLPDGPKVGTVALSPRGDWRMPSDACAALWLNELESL